MARYSPSVAKLISELGKLPGIGHKSAQRLAFHILSLPSEQVADLAGALTEARESTRLCSVCQNFTDKDPCDICSDTHRDSTTICVVENPRDVATMERMRDYQGQYHVLHGVYSPMQNVGRGRGNRNVYFQTFKALRYPRNANCLGASYGF